MVVASEPVDKRRVLPRSCKQERRQHIFEDVSDAEGSTASSLYFLGNVVLSIDVTRVSLSGGGIFAFTPASAGSENYFARTPANGNVRKNRRFPLGKFPSVIGGREVWGSRSSSVDFKLSLPRPVGSTLPYSRSAESSSTSESAPVVSKDCGLDVTQAQQFLFKLAKQREVSKTPDSEVKGNRSPVGHKQSLLHCFNQVRSMRSLSCQLLCVWK